MDLPSIAPGELVVVTGDPGEVTALLEPLAERPGTRLLGSPPGEEWERDDVVTVTLGADHLIGRELGSMSSGERQRVRLGRFLAEPAAEVLLLDEPFAYLDARGIGDALAALRASGSAVLLSCSDPRVHAAADRVLVLADGTLSTVG